MYFDNEDIEETLRWEEEKQRDTKVSMPLRITTDLKPGDQVYVNPSKLINYWPAEPGRDYGMLVTVSSVKALEEVYDMYVIHFNNGGMAFVSEHTLWNCIES